MGRGIDLCPSLFCICFGLKQGEKKSSVEIVKYERSDVYLRDNERLPFYLVLT